MHAHRPQAPRLRLPSLVPLATLAAIAALVAGCAGGTAVAPEPAPGDADGRGGAVGDAVEARGPRNDTSPTLADDAKIVYTGSLRLVVPDLVSALERARAEIVGLGGYVGASRETSEGSSPTATITYRVPSTRWSDGLAAIRALADRVVSEETQATEVGAQLVDLEARIRNLRASETALQEIAAGAGKVTDLLEVERRLTEVRGEIESLDAQRLRLADQVAYGTLVVTFGPDVVAVAKAAEAWDPATEADRAMATLLSIAQGIASAGIWFTIVWVPFIGVLLIAALLVRRGVRRVVRRHPGADGGQAGAIPGWDGA